ncbi:MAG: phosphoribosyltransferase [Actinomycetota bacterium]|nr:phosphoribosyltransferase [Actinomycetota bacterium]
MSLQDDLVASFRWIDGHADIWPWFADADLFAAICEGLAHPFTQDRITKVVGIEARAFLLAGAVARELSAGVVPIRKRGALFPGRHLSTTTASDYRGRTIDLLLQNGVLSSSDRVLIVDDWLEIGSQAMAAASLVRQADAHVVGVGVIVDDSDPALDLRLPRFHSLIRVEQLGPSA